MNHYPRSTHHDPVKRAMRNLVADMKILAGDTRELLRETAGPSNERFAALRERTRNTLSAVEARLGPYQQRLAERGRYAYQVSAEHMRVHRWSTLAAMAAVAFAVAAVVAWQNEGEMEAEERLEE